MVARDEKPQRPVGAMCDADSRRYMNVKWRSASFFPHFEGTLGQVRAVELARDAHRERELTWSRGQSFDPFRSGSAAAHDADACQGLECANEHAARFS